MASLGIMHSIKWIFNLAMNMKYACLALLFFATPVLSETPNALAAWIPTGWKLISTTTGDLNRDGIDDTVLVIEEANAANLKPNKGLGASVLNVNPRRLIILLKTSGGYSQILSRDRLLPSQSDEDMPCLADPLEEGGVSVSRGTLVIKLQEWLSCGSYGVTGRKFTFRFENGRFRLIGYDRSESSRSTGERNDYSINYLTGKKKVITARNASEDSKSRVSWGAIPGKREFYLDEMSLHCDKAGRCR